MDFGDDFNNFVVNELIDSSSSDDDDNFDFNGVNIVAEVLQAEQFIMGLSLDTVLWIVKDFRGTTCFSVIIFQRTQYLVLICLGGG
jgi:hypothetical protein